jgi:hypothetical protein
MSLARELKNNPIQPHATPPAIALTSSVHFLYKADTQGIADQATDEG